MLFNISKYFNIRKQRIHLFLKEGTWVTFGEIAKFVGQLALLRVLTEYMAPSDYGVLILSITVIALADTVLSGGVSIGLTRYIPIAVHQKDIKSYLVAFGHIISFVTFFKVIVGILFIFGFYVLDYKALFSLIIVCTLFSIFNGIISDLSGIKNVLRFRQIDAIHKVLESAFKLVFVIAVIFSLGSDPKYILAAYLAVAVVIVCSRLFFLKKIINSLEMVDIREANVKEWRRKVWEFSWPISLWGVFSWLHLSSDRWVLENLVGTEAVAQYAVSYQLAYSTTMYASGLLGSFITPILYGQVKVYDGKVEPVKAINNTLKIMCVLLSLTIITFFCLWFLHETIFYYLVGSEFHGSSYLLPWLALAGGLFACGQILATGIFASLTSKKLIPIKIGSGVCGLILNIVGTFFWGLEGIVAAVILTSLLYFLWSLRLYKSENYLKNSLM